MSDSDQESDPCLNQKGEKDSRDSTYLECYDPVKWIPQHIKMRTCTQYTPSKNKDICQCGYIKDSIDSHGEEVSNVEWKYTTHTTTQATKAFGDVQFVNCVGNIGKFVGVDADTDMPTMLKLMTNVWKMEKPHLLISVIGGAKCFKMKPHLRKVFRQGLMKAAHSTGAWIITAGTHIGVMKQVGEAVKDNALTSTNQKPVVAIGIAPWGVIRNRNVLENKKGSWPAKYSIEENEEPKESFLDPNHSHFILVDNGTQHNFDTDNLFRAELERKISDPETGKDAVPVPIVTLVLEGGAGTLETVLNALNQNTPAVIVKGSGRAADILAYAFNNTKTAEVAVKDKQEQRTERKLSSSLETEIREHMKEIQFCKNEYIDDNIKRINDCLAKSELIHIFEWDSGTGASDFDEAVLKAMLKAKSHVMDQQLRLALVWNRTDFARTEIFTDDRIWKPGSLDDIMVSAILLDRVEFVELLLDNGVNFETFLTIPRLQQLYKEVSSRSILRVLLNKMTRKKNKKTIELKDVANLILDLLGDHNLLHYEDLDESQRNTEGGVNPEKSEMEPVLKNPCQDLFIWSVLNNRQDMAKLFWRHGKDILQKHLTEMTLFETGFDLSIQYYTESYGKANIVTALINCEEAMKLLALKASTSQIIQP